LNVPKYENMLYTMKLSGKEVHDALEMSYDLWTNRMTSPDDHILLLRDKPRAGAADRASFKNFSFNFDSAAGIIYTVDVTKPAGSKVTILSMADGTPFDMDKMYTVALNSYRGNGGGELLTKGAGIPQDKLKERIITSTDKDLRYYLMQYIEQKKVIEPRALGQWKFIPEEWAVPASKRDYEFLFGKEQE
uniref:5'-nucleotidase C-terminal domain-containing protein n=1 Tax=Bacteroides gallinarum TaxID=376806 RepID=UPI0019CFC8AF